MNYRKRIQNMIQATELQPRYVTETLAYVGEKGLPLHPKTFETILAKTQGIDPSFLDGVVASMDAGVNSTRMASKYNLMREFTKNMEYARSYPR